MYDSPEMAPAPAAQDRLKLRLLKAAAAWLEFERLRDDPSAPDSDPADLNREAAMSIYSTVRLAITGLECKTHHNPSK